MTVNELPVDARVEIETEYYTDWKCSVCKLWQPRTERGLLVTTRAGSAMQCLAHSNEEDDEDEACGCHCHTSNMCPECGDVSW